MGNPKKAILTDTPGVLERLFTTPRKSHSAVAALCSTLTRQGPTRGSARATAISPSMA